MDLKHFMRGFGTQLFNISMCFLMMCVSIHLDMKITPVLFGASVWLGLQDAFWSTARKDGDRRTQFEFWFYHLARMWVYSIAFLVFTIEYIIQSA